LTSAIVAAFHVSACTPNDARIIESDSSYQVSSPATPADTHIVAFLQAQKKAWKAPSISASVAVRGEVVFSATVGLANAGKAVPATSETIYRIASTSKALTAVAILQLVDQGLLTLDDDVRKYVPEFPEKKWPITVGNVLSHTSGIRHYREGETSRKSTHYDSVADAIGEFKDDSLLFEPGTQYGYTTFGYTLLQGVIERASGMTYREYMRERVWRPAGMTHTDLEVKGDLYPLRAAGYRMDADRIGEVGFDDVSFKYAGGGMISSTDDLVKFCMSLCGSTLLPDSLRNLMFTELVVEPGVSLAWGSRMDERTGSRRVWHPGRSNGFESYLLFYPEEQVAVAVLTNQHYTDPWVQVGGVAQLLANIFMPGHEADRGTFPTTSPGEAVLETLRSAGPEAGVTKCREYQASAAWQDWGMEWELNRLGYELLEQGRSAEAVELLKLVVYLYPESWNAYDSLGDAYAKTGDVQLAIQNYESSLKLNPDNPAGAEKLSKLQK